MKSKNSMYVLILAVTIVTACTIVWVRSRSYHSPKEVKAVDVKQVTKTSTDAGLAAFEKWRQEHPEWKETAEQKNIAKEKWIQAIQRWETNQKNAGVKTKQS